MKEIKDIVELSKQENANIEQLIEDAYIRGVLAGQKIFKDAIKKIFNKE